MQARLVFGFEEEPPALQAAAAEKEAPMVWRWRFEKAINTTARGGWGAA